MTTQTEALKLALEALTATMSTHGFRDAIDEAHDKAITAIKEALAQEKALQALHDENERLGLYKDAYAQPEQEPVAFLTNRRQRLNVEFNATGLTLMPKSVDWKIPLYTTPPQRTWVGLDPEEIRKTNHHMVDGAYHYSFKQGAEWAEAKLKEKNT